MIGSFIKSTKDFINITMKFAPLFIGVTLLVFGLITNNLAYLMSFLGMFIFMPIIVYVLYYIFDMFISKKYPSMLLFDPSADADEFGIMFPKLGEKNSPPYMWYSMIVFFMGYLFINAKDIYDYKIKNISQAKEDVRKIRAVIGMIVSILVLLLFLSFRSSTMLIPETQLGLVILGLASIGFAYGWHTFLTGCSSAEKNVHLDDLYSIKTNVVAVQPRNICIAKEND